MIKPKFEDFVQGFQSFKHGTTVTEMVFSFLYSVGNQTIHLRFDKLKTDLLPQHEIITMLNSMKEFVADYDGYSTVLKFEHMNSENKLLKQEIEQKRIDYLANIFVTGFHVSGTDNQNIKITYKKIAKDHKITGHATQGINTQEETFGFEQKLERTISDLIKEIYAYVYEGKHSDSDQSELEIWQGKYEVVPEVEETADA